MIRLGLLLIFNTFLFSVSCSEPAAIGEHESHSSLHYLIMSSSNKCLVAKALDPEIRVCFSGSGVNENVKQHVKGGILEWFEPLRKLNSRVTASVQFSCSNPQLTVNVNPGNGTASAGCGRINSYSQRPYGSFLHELGHALAGLSDTYQGRQAGSCRPGQPESIMCWGAYGQNRLYPDDIEGVINQFKKFHSVTNPGTGQPGNTQGQLFAAIGAANNGAADSHTLLFSATINAERVVLCDGAQQDCSQLSTGYQQTTFVTQTSRKFFRTGQFVNITPNKQLTIISKNSLGQTLTRRVIRFNQRQ